MHGLQFNTLTIRNFLSFGNKPTTIDLRGDRITVVLGINHDTGGDESRNGVGKSALIDSISYALFGKTIRGISNAKLVNKMARKGQGMLVELEFDTGSGSYRIERGEAPSKLRLFRKELDDDADFLTRDGTTFVYDVSRNKNETTAEIERIIGFDIKLFEFLIANSSESDAFMKLPEDKKREIAERLMGLNLLTERATELKEDRKDKKRELVGQESALDATRQANARIERQLADLRQREEQWTQSHTKRVADIRGLIDGLSGIDVAEQIELLKMIDELDADEKATNAEYAIIDSELRDAKRKLGDIKTAIKTASVSVDQLCGQHEKMESGVCPTCQQSWVPSPDTMAEIEEKIEVLASDIEAKTALIPDAETDIEVVETKLAVVADTKAELAAAITEISQFDIVFDTVAAASSASATLAAHLDRLDALLTETNPHTDTISGFQTGAIKHVDDSEVKSLQVLIQHYDYLIELLQSKDSFLRKAVIDKWLPQLNGRIAHYLQLLELPHIVRIENDLTMTITDFGEDYDWGNLSKGQRQRVTIALNLAFQDLFEATNHPLSLLMIDELIDAGICNRGASRAVSAFTEAAERKHKRVFLITHRADIADQLPDTMLVEMRNKISTIVESSAEDYDDE